MRLFAAAALLLALFPLPALAVTAPLLPPPDRGAPPAGSLVFGCGPERVKAVLGASSHVEDLAGFEWHDYQAGGTTVRVAYYKQRTSMFNILPGRPLALGEALAWARAFVPGLKPEELKPAQDGKRTAFRQLVIYGRPFEAELDFAMQDTRVSSLSGELHWLD